MSIFVDICCFPEPGQTGADERKSRRNSPELRRMPEHVQHDIGLRDGRKPLLSVRWEYCGLDDR